MAKKEKYWKDGNILVINYCDGNPKPIVDSGFRYYVVNGKRAVRTTFDGEALDIDDYNDDLELIDKHYWKNRFDIIHVYEMKI